MQIGITERGDAGIDLGWLERKDTVDGMVLITKNLTKPFRNHILELNKSGYKIILHCTCTGFGGTELEPFVPDYKTQLNNLKQLIEDGFPAKNCVLRIDPIFPSTNGLKRVHELLNYFISLNTGVTRVRVSIVDEYKHVKERYRAHGWTPLYGDNFYPSFDQMKMTANTLNQFDFTFETCAESQFSKMLKKVDIIGCVSLRDLKILDLPEELMTENPQGRSGCRCLSCKTELLIQKEKHPCAHQCVYCFWKS